MWASRLIPQSGNRYRDRGKLWEGAIQYANALQMDPRFAQAHDQLGEIYLKLKEYNQAYAELSRTVDLAPENYTAHMDLANLLTAGDKRSRRNLILTYCARNSRTVRSE
jgi:tetratricopeptide (TPR) repeat protein